jgi:hypothetical protein
LVSDDGGFWREGGRCAVGGGGDGGVTRVVVVGGCVVGVVGVGAVAGAVFVVLVLVLVLVVVIAATVPSVDGSEEPRMTPLVAVTGADVAAGFTSTGVIGASTTGGSENFGIGLLVFM